MLLRDFVLGQQSLVHLNYVYSMRIMLNLSKYPVKTAYIGFTPALEAGKDKREVTQYNMRKRKRCQAFEQGKI